GVVGDTTENVLWRVENGELAGQPKAVVIEVGTNNLGLGNTPAETAQGIEAVVAAVRAASPRSHILVLGILPRGQGASDALTVQASVVNSIIAQQFDGTTVHFLDVGSKFLNADGTLNPSLFVDGLHPSEAGYQVLGNAVTGALRSMLGHGASPRITP